MTLSKITGYLLLLPGLALLGAWGALPVNMLPFLWYGAALGFWYWAVVKFPCAKHRTVFCLYGLCLLLLYVRYGVLVNYFSASALGFGLLFTGIGLSGIVRGGLTRADSIAKRALALSPIRVLSIFCLFVLCAASYYSGALFFHVPMIMDSIAQNTQAYFVAHGMLVGRAPEHPEFFAINHSVITNGLWYSQYSPGHTLILALGHMLGAVWLVNPVLGMLTALCVWHLARDVYGVRTANIAALLCCSSVYLLVMSAEFMNHATSLLTVCLFFLCYFRYLDTNKLRYAALAGCAIGFCFITRPFTAMSMAAPAGLYALWQLRHSTRRPGTLLMALCFAGFVGFQLYYNAITTGEPLKFGYQLAHYESHNPFTADAWGKVTLSQVVFNLTMLGERLQMMGRVLFAWGVPATCFALLTVLFIRPRAKEMLMALGLLLLMAAHLPTPGYKEYGYGPRFYYEGIGLLIVLSARGIMLVPMLLRLRTKKRYPHALGAVLLIVLSFWAYAAPRDYQLENIKDTYALRGRASCPELYESLLPQLSPPALVFVEQEKRNCFLFAGPFLDSSPVIFAEDMGEHNSVLKAQYPYRKIYHLANGQLKAD